MNQLPVAADWYTATEVGIVVTGKPTLQQIDGEIALWNTVRELSTWALADLVKYAWEKFGEDRAYDEVQAMTRYQKSYLYNIVSVANKVAPETRRPYNETGMTFSHHLAVAPLEPELQEKWLDYASEKQHTRDELRQDIQDYGTPPTSTLPEPKQVVIEVQPTLEETVMYYVRAVKRDDATLSLYYFGLLEKKVERLL